MTANAAVNFSRIDLCPEVVAVIDGGSHFRADKWRCDAINNIAYHYQWNKNQIGKCNTDFFKGAINIDTVGKDRKEEASHRAGNHEPTYEDQSQETGNEARFGHFFLLL